jgi:hypothetical protein
VIRRHVEDVLWVLGWILLVLAAVLMTQGIEPWREP